MKSNSLGWRIMKTQHSKPVQSQLISIDVGRKLKLLISEDRSQACIIRWHSLVPISYSFYFNGGWEHNLQRYTSAGKVKRSQCSHRLDHWLSPQDQSQGRPECCNTARQICLPVDQSPLSVGTICTSFSRSIMLLSKSRWLQGGKLETHNGWLNT